MNTISINLNVPQGWHELDDAQLRYVYSLIAKEFAADEIKTLALLKWATPKVRVEGLGVRGKYLCSLRTPHSTLHFELSGTQLAEVIPSLGWLDAIPASPVRLKKLRNHASVDAEFQGVPFETYIVVENLYQGFLSTQKDALLDEIAAVLYKPTAKVMRLGGYKVRLTPAERISIFYLVASLKDMFARRFSDFFQPASANAENLLGSSPNIGKQLQESMDAQIRALTKGDITKEKEILSLDTWRALTELNAQAKEYKQINAQINAKK